MKPSLKQRLVTFILGAAVGAAGVWTAAPHLIRRRFGEERSPQRLLSKFSSKLDLTADQREKIAVILEAKRQKLDALRGEIRPRFDAIRSSASAEIRQLLTPQQKKKFDALETTQRARREQFRKLR